MPYEKRASMPQATPSAICLRPATADDAEALSRIYAPYVETTAITFEYEAPTAEEFRRRIAETEERYPWLVACGQDNPSHIFGYAYASVYHGRPAYWWSVETSIYLAQDARGKGIGRILHDGLVEELKRRGIQNMYACITAIPEGRRGDPYLTDASIRFHTKLGYRMIGRFQECGYKFSRWYDVVWMELMIGDHPVPAPPLGWE